MESLTRSSYLNPKTFIDKAGKQSYTEGDTRNRILSLMHIYLDESGDLGFDFTKQGTSRFFVITLLVIHLPEVNKRILKMVERTIKEKINRSKKGKNVILELKGSNTDIRVKGYFYRHIKNEQFEIFTLILNKARVAQDLRAKKEKLYNFISRLLLEKCHFHKVEDRIILTVDKRKNKEDIRDFNRYLFITLRELIPLKVPFEQYHEASYSHKGLQAVDVFSWGIFRKYERGDVEWYSYFRDKIKQEVVYLPEKRKWL